MFEHTKRQTNRQKDVFEHTKGQTNRQKDAFEHTKRQTNRQKDGQTEFANFNIDHTEMTSGGAPNSKLILNPFFIQQMPFTSSTTFGGTTAPSDSTILKMVSFHY